MSFRGARLVCGLAFFAFALNPPVFAQEGKTLQIKGSDTMVNLGQAWSEEFMNRHPEVSIAVTGGGSGTGIAALISKSCHLAQSSRDVSEEERKKAKANGVDIHETMVGYDGIAVIVNVANPLDRLTLDQVSDLFTGKVTNWKELGGHDSPVLLLSRERNSGTHIFFLEHVLRHGDAKGPEEFSVDALMMPSNQAIVQEVESSEAGVGYVGLGYVDEGHKVVRIAKTAGADYVQPDLKTVQDGTYPISRSLFFLTPGPPQGEVKAFVDFVLSPEGQDIVEMLDFVPLKK